MPLRNLSFSLIMLLLFHFSSCGYYKQAYIQTESNVSSLVSCRTHKNLIYSTMDSKINLWVNRKQIKSYQIELAGNGTKIELYCSHYGERFDKTYIVGVVNNTQVYVWEEIVYNLDSSNQYEYDAELKKVTFTKPAQKIIGVSIASTYLSIQHPQNLVRIHNLNNLLMPPIVLHLDFNVSKIMLDTQGNLLIISNQNRTLYLHYYLDVYRQNDGTVLSKKISWFNEMYICWIKLDYAYQNEQERNQNLKILIGNGQISKIIYFKKASSQLSEFEDIQNVQNAVYINSGVISPSRFCCGMLCTLNYLLYAGGDQITTANDQIIDFTCMRDIKNNNNYFFVSSLYVSFNRDKYKYFIDVSDQYSFMRFLVYLLGGTVPVFCIYLNFMICSCFRQKRYRCFFLHLCCCVEKDGTFSINQQFFKNVQKSLEQ